MDPNAVFRQCFDWFVVKYGRTLAEDCKTNCTAMAANRHPSIGFKVLTLRLFHGVTFASLSGHPITDNNTINISVRILNHTGVFAKECKAWILRGDDASKTNNLAAFQVILGKCSPNCGVYLSPCKPAWIWYGCNQRGRRIPHGCGVKLRHGLRRHPRITKIHHHQHCG
jgi:hypothetical protein